MHDWHVRLNHTSVETIRIMAGRAEVTGIDPQLNHGRPPISCSGFAAGHAQPAPHNSQVTCLPPGHTLAVDVAGPLPPTPEGFRHVLVVTELASRFRVAYLLRRRSEATKAMLTGVTAIARHYGQAPARLRMDNANKLLTKGVLHYCAQRAIRVAPTVAHTPQENAVVERVFRTIFGRVRSTLTTTRMPFAKYWGWAALDTVVKLNST